MKWRNALAVALGAPLGLLAVLLGPASPASAHAAVVSTAPAQGSVIGSSPTSAVVTFNEPVRLVPDRVQVVAPDGKRINTGTPTVSGNTLTIPLRAADRPLGSYLVSYRVISADNHPVAGTFTFAVGARSETVPTAVDTAVDTGVDPVVSTFLPITRYVGYAGVILIVGPVLMLAALWPHGRRRPERGLRRPSRSIEHSLSRRGPIRLVGVGLALVVASTLAAFWLQAPYASGSTVLNVSGRELGQVLTSPFGAILAVRLAIVAAIIALVRPMLYGGGSRLRRGALTVLGLAGLATWPLSGHPGAAPIPVAAVIADTVHLAAAAVWIGGLVVLTAFVLRKAHERVLAVILPVWSRWAMAAVCYLALAGAVQAFIQLGALRELTRSDYGKLILVKVGLLVVVIGIAWLSRRLVQRRLGLKGMLRRTVAAELAITAVILGFSAVLVQTTPGRSDAAAVAPAASDSFAETLNSSLYTLQFDIFPVQLGEYNTLHAYLYTPEGKPLPIQEIRVTTALPSGGIEPLDNPIGITEQTNHALGSITFPMPGDWQVRFTIRTSEVDQATVTATVPVRAKRTR